MSLEKFGFHYAFRRRRLVNMRVKDSLSGLIGKVISGVVVAEYGQGDPSTRMFLTFSDGTAFELWEDQFGVEMAGDLDDVNLDQLVEMLKMRPSAKLQVFRPPHEDPNKPQRDLLTDR